MFGKIKKCSFLNDLTFLMKENYLNFESLMNETNRQQRK